MKRTITALLVLLVTLVLPGCSGNIPEDTEIPVTTEFGRALGSVPYSFLEEQDFWFSDWVQAKKVHGFEGATSIEEAASLPEEERDALREALMDIIPISWSNLELAPVSGFDGMMIDRSVFAGIIPPRSFSISEGSFDEELIAGKLTELGYETAERGAYTYYTRGEDFKIDMGNELSRMVLSSMNRLAVLDDTIVAAPSTEKMAAILDTMAGDVPSVIDNAACRALADSLGEVLTAVMTTPDRVTNPDPNMEGMPAFNFTVPEDWGLLHRFEMAAMGLRNDGEERTLVISLHYTDAGAARDDGDELVKRMESYSLGTQFENMENIPLTDWLDIGEPTVRHYTGGATLTVSCRFLSEKGRPFLLLGATGTRDALFLAPDPAPYIKE